MLDSGAYSAYTQNKVIDIQAYADFVKKNGPLFDWYFNLDVISDGEKSLANWLWLREQGLDPVPIYHATTDISFLTIYLGYHPKLIGIGAIANLSTQKRIESLDRIWEKHLTYDDGMPKHKAHGLGILSIDILRRYPWYSSDSTSWVQFGKFGIVLVPRSKQGKWVYDENPFKVFFSIRSPKTKDKGEHFDNFPLNTRIEIARYVESYGFVVGKSEWGEDGKEKVIVEGARNNGFIRDQLNLMYYQNVVKNLPSYPWPFKSKSLKTFF